MNFKFRSKEQENFSKLLSAHLKNPDKPLLLEGATGLGKTRAYLYPLLQAASEGKRVAIILPTHQLIEQLINSTDLKVCNLSSVDVQTFIPKRHFETPEEYKAQREAAIQAPVMLCTSASVIIDQRLGGKYNGVTERDYLLFDEADQLVDVAALQSDVSISSATLRDFGVVAESALQTVKDLLNIAGLEPEDRAAAKIILDAINNPSWFNKKVGIDSDGGVSLYHKLPGRLLKRTANKPNSAFISATLTVANKFDDFQRSMGIESTTIYSSIVEPQHHGKLSFKIADSYPTKTEEWWGAVLLEIDSADKPCLVVTSSHDISNTLAEKSTNAISRRQEIDETASQAALRLLNDDTKDTLIATAAWAGLDTPIIWKSIVVPKIPFSPPVNLDGKVESHYINSRNTAIRRMRQVIGRGLRSADAECSIIICDPSWPQIESFIPSRFQQAWDENRTYSEGAARHVKLSQKERCQYLRKQALKEYGLVCHVCGMKPKTPNQIQIHHLDPIAEGERKTTIDDVRPLCGNCHLFAHSETPPLTIEFMRAVEANPKPTNRDDKQIDRLS
ncbi:DEAD/DEAH box helicase [Porticoccaceae bacterium]|nr:DEAD/DEAH box helicase [Porticoccaceae bacterium]MDB2343116.1 DEAD/DEAH box helicase [Porticoccaceae bacterium]